MTRLDAMRAIVHALGVSADELQKLADEFRQREQSATCGDALRSRPAAVTQQDRDDAARVLARAGARVRR